MYPSKDKAAALGITKQQLADERAERGGKHADMEIAFKIQLFLAQVKKWGQKTGPHVKKIQTIEAVSNYQKISGHSIGPGFSFQKIHEQKTGHPAR